MDSSLGQAVGAVAPKHEQTRDHGRDETARLAESSKTSDDSVRTQVEASGLPISHGRFEFPTEIFSALMQEARPLMSA